jgi:hypothetical protein
MFLSCHPEGPGPFPGVLDMWGGGGGLVEYRAALLASHGFAAMALMYLFPDAQKAATIGFHYIEVCICPIFIWRYKRGIDLGTLKTTVLHTV